MVKLLIVVLPVVANVPKVPIPLIVILDKLVTLRKLLFGVKLPWRVSVLLPIDKFPLVRARLPVMVRSAASVTPEALLTVV